MNTNRISVRYAKALFSAAQEQKVALELSKDMQMISELAKDPGFKYFLENPVMKSSEKAKAFEKMFKSDCQKLSIDFFNLLVKNGRESFLTNIARNYIHIYRKENNILAVDISSAQELSKSFVKQISDAVSTRFNKKVELNLHKNEDLIGGFLIRTEDKLFDGTAADKLRNIRKALLEK